MGIETESMTSQKLRLCRSRDWGWGRIYLLCSCCWPAIRKIDGGFGGVVISSGPALCVGEFGSCFITTAVSAAERKSWADGGSLSMNNVASSCLIQVEGFPLKASPSFFSALSKTWPGGSVSTSGPAGEVGFSREEGERERQREKLGSTLRRLLLLRLEWLIDFPGAFS